MKASAAISILAIHSSLIYQYINMKVVSEPQLLFSMTFTHRSSWGNTQVEKNKYIILSKDENHLHSSRLTTLSVKDNYHI